MRKDSLGNKEGDQAIKARQESLVCGLQACQEPFENTGFFLTGKRGHCMLFSPSGSPIGTETRHIRERSCSGGFC